MTKRVAIRSPLAQFLIFVNFVELLLHNSQSVFYATVKPGIGAGPNGDDPWLVQNAGLGPEQIKAMVVAYGSLLIVPKLTNRDDPLTERKIFEYARRGARDRIKLPNFALEN